MKNLDKRSRKWLLEWSTDMSKPDLIKRLQQAFESDLLRWIIASRLKNQVYIALSKRRKLNEMITSKFCVLARNVVDSILPKHAKSKLGRSFEVIYPIEEVVAKKTPQKT